MVLYSSHNLDIVGDIFLAYTLGGIFLVCILADFVDMVLLNNFVDFVNIFDYFGYSDYMDNNNSFKTLLIIPAHNILVCILLIYELQTIFDIDRQTVLAKFLVLYNPIYV